MVEKVARHLVATHPVEHICAQVCEALADTPKLEQLRERARTAHSEAVAMLANIQLPHVPTTEELRERAKEMFAATPSMDDIVARAREIIIEAIATELWVTSPATA